ncbi:MAG: hypothetical protein OZ921_17645, partial [Sorangiineae bacterium]|nr:hypothetical protein [Sorangiineae bacterium]
ERAESELSAAGSDCALACKALASMRRSTARICELDARAEAGARCRSARARLGAAEERVARGCGRCAG